MSSSSLHSWLTVVLSVALCGCDDGAESTNTFYGPPCSDAQPCPEGSVCGHTGYCVSLQDRRADAACTSLAECLFACEDDACVTGCVRGTTPAGIDRYEALIMCIEDNECVNADGHLDAECVTGPCAGTYEGCFGALPPHPEGDASCGELIDCLSSCPAEDPECGGACVTASSPEAMELYVAAIDCLTATECMPGDAICQNEACGEEIRACVDDGLGFGSLSCDAVMECVFSCGDPECGQRCILNADAEGLAFWREFASCAGAARCNSRSTCFAVCPQQTQACAADR
jgi:hypothetical protein